MSTEHSPRADLVHIQHALSIILEPGSVAELRVPNTRKGTRSGYFDDFDKLVHAAADMSGVGAGAYVTLNPVNPALLARSANHVTPWVKQTTSDDDILRRRWALIDTDANRPAGISSSDSEHQVALERADQILRFLLSSGFPQDCLLLADSGNGAHILFRVNFPNDIASTVLLQRCLLALDLLFSDNVAHVDVGTYNPARLLKVYGTLAAKGDPPADRPHRLARLLKVPAQVIPASKEALEQLAAMAPAAPKTRRASQAPGAFDLEAWIANHSLPVVAAGPWGQGGRKWVLSPCPWNPDHVNRSAYIVQFVNGAIAVGVRLNGCVRDVTLSRKGVTANDSFMP